MTSLTIAVVISRDSLGLGDLSINDHVSYIVAGPEFLGGNQSWDRVQVNSIFVEGDITTHRRRQNVMEPVSVEVLADTMAELKSKTSDLVDAFSQDKFTMNVSISGDVTVYSCEAADAKVTFTTPRLAAKQLQVAFNVPRKPLIGTI